MTERDADGHARFDALVTHYPSSTHVAARPSIRPVSLLEFLFSLFLSPADNTHVGDGGSGDPLRQPASRRGMSCTYCMHVCAVPGHPLYFCRLPSRFPFLVETFAFFFVDPILLFFLPSFSIGKTIRWFTQAPTGRWLRSLVSSYFPSWLPITLSPPENNLRVLRPQQAGRETMMLG